MPAGESFWIPELEQYLEVEVNVAPVQYRKCLGESGMDEKGCLEAQEPMGEVTLKNIQFLKEIVGKDM